MGFRHGRFAEITVNAVALSAFCDSADIDIKVDTASTETFQATWKTALTGLIGASVSLSGDYDPTEDTGPADTLTDLVGADPFAVVIYPGGNVAGQLSRSFNAILTNYKETSKVNDKVLFSATLLVTGAVTFGEI